MAAFVFHAVDDRGRKSKGVVEATSAAAARQSLRGRKLLPLSVEPTRQRPKAAASGLGIAALGAGRGIGVRALTLVTRQLATLVGARVPIEQALRIVADQARAPRVKSLMLNLRSSVMDGQSLAAALDDYPKVFGEFYRASVRAGEASGQLDAVMEHLATHVEQQAKNLQTLQLALIYPALLALVSLGVIVALLTFVVPDIVRVFTSRGADLPFLTRALIAVSDGVNRFGLAALGVVFVAGGAGLWALRHPPLRLRWHRFLARTPGTRGFVARINAAQFTGTLATLVVSRVPLTDALKAATDTVPNIHIRARMSDVAVRVREGAALSRAMTDAEVFPPMLLAMVVSGEASGNLGPALERAAEDQTRDLKALVSTLVALVEPGVLLIMGGIVMVLVLAILLPIVNLNSLVG